MFKPKENNSEITSPKIKLVHIASIPLLIDIFNKRYVAKIFTSNSIHCDIALL